MEKNHKRKCRKLSEETKLKISNSMKGKKKTEEHRQHIKEGMIDYWKTVPYE